MIPAAVRPPWGVRAGVLASSEAGLALLRADGWTEGSHTPRMQRGDAFAWQPDAIRGQLSFAMG